MDTPKKIAGISSTRVFSIRAKTIRVPSGDQTGHIDGPGPKLKRVRVPPAKSESQMLPNPVVESWTSAARRFPSGEIEKSR